MHISLQVRVPYVCVYIPIMRVRIPEDYFVQCLCTWSTKYRLRKQIKDPFWQAPIRNATLSATENCMYRVCVDGELCTLYRKQSMLQPSHEQTSCFAISSKVVQQEHFRGRFNYIVNFQSRTCEFIEWVQTRKSKFNNLIAISKISIHDS